MFWLTLIFIIFICFFTEFKDRTEGLLLARQSVYHPVTLLTYICGEQWSLNHCS